MLKRLNDFWYWIRCHTYNRYHILDLRNPVYKWGWADVDYRMLYACFNLMKEFVEKEYTLEALNKPYEPIKNVGTIKDPSYEEWEQNYNVEHEHFHNELKDLYCWWKNIEKHKDEFGYWHFDGECDKNLERLMKIRRMLWT